jgi:hypothetical protein
MSAVKRKFVFFDCDEKLMNSPFSSAYCDLSLAARGLSC